MLPSRIVSSVFPIASNCHVGRQAQPRNSSGSSLTVERDNDKNPVVALREIADETVPLDDLVKSSSGSSKHIEVDEPEEDDEIEMMTAASLAKKPYGGTAAGVGADTSDKMFPISVRMTSPRIMLSAWQS